MVGRVSVKLNLVLQANKGLCCKVVITSSLNPGSRPEKVECSLQVRESFKRRARVSQSLVCEFDR